MEHFEALIVGAGPAGSFAAELLARAGVKVALLDGRPEGEPKACGGAVTAKALKAWPHLLNAVGRTVDELEMYSPSGKRLHLQLDEPFAIYSRVAFDSYLRDRARNAGAKILSERISVRGIKRTENCWILRGTSGAEFEGEILVGADGANSGVAKMLAGSLPPSEMEVAFGYRAPLPESGEIPTVVAFLPGWDGYAWAFPRLDHVSFGVATSYDSFDHEMLDRLLEDFIIGYYLGPGKHFRPIHSGRRQAPREIRERILASVERYAGWIPKLKPSTWDTRRTAAENWALLGDSAGFADPVTGEGIYYALRSAELCAEAYLGGSLKSYEELWRVDFGDSLRRAAHMRARFYGSFLGAPFTERMIRLAQFHGGIRRILRDLVAGDQGYTDLKKKLALRIVQAL